MQAKRTVLFSLFSENLISLVKPDASEELTKDIENGARTFVSLTEIEYGC